MSEEEIYEQLRDWLKKTWYAIPEAEELLPLIKATYTPGEASLLTGMPFKGMNLEELAEMKQMDPQELRQQLDSMAEKGQVFRTVKGDTVRYSLNDAFFVDYRSTFWPGRTDERIKAIAPLANQYYYPEAKDRVTVVEADSKSQKKKLKNKKGKVSTVNPDFCIGCGVCAYRCPSKSMVLEKREVIHHPPKDVREYMKLVMADFAAAQSTAGEKES